MESSSSHRAPQADAASLTAIYGALADPTRREMMERLETGECSITGLAKHFPISRVEIGRAHV